MMKKFSKAINYLTKYKRYQNKNLLELYKTLEENRIGDDENNSLSLNDINCILQLIKETERKYFIPSGKSCGIVPEANPCGDANDY